MELQQYKDRKIVLLTGGSGLIGQRLNTILTEAGYLVKVLSRNPKGKSNYFKWDTNSQEIEAGALENVECIINLAGAGIVDARWTDRRKKVLIESRVKSIETLSSNLDRLNIKVPCIIGASAIGFYGNRSDEILDVKSSAGNDGFLSTCSVEWEKATQTLSNFTERFSIVRIGIVLSNLGGALPEILKPMKLGVGGYFGNGEQYYSWIDIDDLCSIFINILEQENLSGIYNGVSPHPEPMKTFVQKIKKTLNYKGLILGIPKTILRLAMGEMSTMLTNSTRVVPNRLLKDGFVFKYEKLEDSLNHVVKDNV